MRPPRRTNNNAARKLRPVPPPVNLAPRERHRSALAGFILCALFGAAFGYGAGLLTCIPPDKASTILTAISIPKWWRSPRRSSGGAAGSFDPATFRDRYQKALRELIAAKVKGLPVRPKRIAEPRPVMDLMAALKRSLAQETARKLPRQSQNAKPPAIAGKPACCCRWPERKRRRQSRRPQRPRRSAAGKPELAAAGPRRMAARRCVRESIGVGVNGAPDELSAAAG